MVSDRLAVRKRYFLDIGRANFFLCGHSRCPGVAERKDRARPAWRLVEYFGGGTRGVFEYPPREHAEIDGRCQADGKRGAQSQRHGSDGVPSCGSRMYIATMMRR